MSADGAAFSEPPVMPSNGMMRMIADPAMLCAAWRRVRANRGGAGRDGVTISAFGNQLDTELAVLSARLLDGGYRPRPLRRAFITKRSGGRRRLAIPCVADRVVQTATLLTLAPALDHHFCPSSYGYRPGRGVEDAITDLTMAINSDRRFIVDIDIEAYFDSIPHHLLLSELAIWIDDEKVLRLFSAWLRRFSRIGRGVAQGSPISPLLSNLFLHPIDRILSSEGFRPIRYADDMVIPCADPQQAKAAMRLLRALLASRKLKLSEAKSRITGPGEPLTFLGRVIQLPEPRSEDA